MLIALLTFMLAGAAVAAPAVSRDGHFSAELPQGYAWVLGQYPAATHGHIVAAWEVPGPGFRRLEAAVQSLRYMTPEELKRPAAASCERWARLDELAQPCREAALASGVKLEYTIRGTRSGADAFTGFFDLGGGLVYCLMTQVPSGAARGPAVQGLIAALGTLQKADSFQVPPAPRCESGERAVFENWPKAGDWKCREADDGEPRIIAPTDEPFNPYRRAEECPPGLTLAKVDEPRAGDLGCVDFAQTTQRLLERYEHKQIFKCARDERPELYKKEGLKRDFVCAKLPKPKPADDSAAQ